MSRHIKTRVHSLVGPKVRIPGGLPCAPGVPRYRSDGSDRALGRRRRSYAYGESVAFLNFTEVGVRVAGDVLCDEATVSSSSIDFCSHPFWTFIIAYERRVFKSADSCRIAKQLI